jgi:hypothetical protein
MIKAKDDLLTIGQAAEMLGVASATVRGWLNRDSTRGLLPNAQRLETPRGPVWMIPQSDVMALSQQPLPKSGPKPKPKDEKAKASKKKN